MRGRGRLQQQRLRHRRGAEDQGHPAAALLPHDLIQQRHGHQPQPQVQHVRALWETEALEGQVVQAPPEGQREVVIGNRQPCAVRHDLWICSRW